MLQNKRAAVDVAVYLCIELNDRNQHRCDHCNADGINAECMHMRVCLQAHDALLNIEITPLSPVMGVCRLSHENNKKKTREFIMFKSRHVRNEQTNEVGNSTDSDGDGMNVAANTKLSLHSMRRLQRISMI